MGIRPKGKPRDIHDLLKQHVEAWGRMADLIEVCTKERDAGNLKVARKTFVQIERLLAEITALEEMVRPKAPAGGMRPHKVLSVVPATVQPGPVVNDPRLAKAVKGDISRGR